MYSIFKLINRDVAIAHLGEEVVLKLVTLLFRTVIKLPDLCSRRSIYQRFMPGNSEPFVWVFCFSLFGFVFCCCLFGCFLFVIFVLFWGFLVVVGFLVFVFFFIKDYFV